MKRLAIRLTELVETIYPPSSNCPLFKNIQTSAHMPSAHHGDAYAHEFEVSVEERFGSITKDTRRAYAHILAEYTAMAGFSHVDVEKNKDALYDFVCSYDEQNLPQGQERRVSGQLEKEPWKFVKTPPEIKERTLYVQPEERESKIQRRPGGWG